MNYGRQLRLFLADGTSSGPRFYEIVNRTIQALGIPAIRIKELVSDEWPDFQKPGVYLVLGSTEDGKDTLYVGKGENVGKRVQGHPDNLEFEVTSLLLFSSKDENLNASQVGWLESKLIAASSAAKRITIANIQNPEPPVLSKAELATVSEFFDDLILIAQTAGFDLFTPPKTVTLVGGGGVVNKGEAKEFILQQPTKNITARGYLSDDGFVVRATSEASATPNESLQPGYAELRKKLIDQGVLVKDLNDNSKLRFAVDYAFTAPSPAAAIVVGNNYSGTKNWKTQEGTELGEYIESMTKEEE